MTDFDIDKMHHIAEAKAAEIIEAWWFEFGSWDGDVEDGGLTVEEVQFIQKNWEVKIQMEYTGE